MRKLVFLLSLFLFSCNSHVSEFEATRASVEGKIPFDEAEHFVYHNHEYIKFLDLNGNATNSGVVHNPDCNFCKCRTF